MKQELSITDFKVQTTMVVQWGKWMPTSTLIMYIMCGGEKPPV